MMHGMRASLIIATVLAATAPAVATPQTAPPQARLRPGAALPTMPRYGVNLGGRTAWGAEQLMANVLRNPGLEAGHDGAIVVAARATATSVVDDTPWTARPEGFWTGARFEVLSGRAAGQAGRVVDDRPSREASAGTSRKATEYLLDPPVPGLQSGDVLALEGAQDHSPAPLWWTRGSVRAQPGDARPGSLGQQSLRLVGTTGQPAALLHHLDGIGSRAGKLLPVIGRWQLALWARAHTPGARLRASFGRSGSAAWVSRDWQPTAQWQRLVIDFDARDDGPVGPLQLTLAVEHGELSLDDIELGAVEAGPGGFRPAVVAALRSLRPGYLRDWQGQLADTPANRGAAPTARHPVRYRPGNNEWQFAYSLDEFCDLAEAVGARPWLVLPATSTPAQARAFGRALAVLWRRHRFDEIVVEHGNEHWNSVFRPAGIAVPSVLAEVADRAFAALREGAGAEVPLHRVLGAQYVRAGAAAVLAGRSRHSEGIAVAPYLLYRMEHTETPAQALQRAFEEPDTLLRNAQRSLAAAGRTLDVYEVNLHTTGGDAISAQRDAAVTAAAAGAALVRRLLQATLVGVTRQAVYSLAGYDTFTQDPARSLVRLFGITRDLAGPVRLRATGTALAQLNAVVGGATHMADCSGPGCAALTAVAFDAAPRWAVVSAAATTTALAWDCRTAQTVGWLDGSVPLTSGSDADADASARWQTARIECSEGVARFELPARSFLTAAPALR